MKAWPPIVTADAVPTASPLGDPPVRRMGEILCSAIKRGGLLDRRWWAPWIAGVQNALDLRPGQLAVDMMDSGHGRRWFADPVTRLLIAQWHEDGLALPRDVAPDDCLAAYLPRRAAQGANFTRDLLDDARAAWRLRLPGVLFAYAVGTGPSASVPRSAWLRIVHGRDVPLDPPAAPAPRDIAKVAPRKAAGWSTNAERNALQTGEATGNGARLRRRAKIAMAKGLEALPPATSAVQSALRAWAAFALRREAGRASLGYELSTTEGYLGHLERLFSAWEDSSPLDVGSIDLARYISANLSQDKDKSAKAALSFVRFFNNQNPDDHLELDDVDIGSGGMASAAIVTPTTYRRALQYLDITKRDEAAALALVLAFRTGMRAEEVAGLRAGDIADAGDQVDLVLEENDERALKTKTSRRILPLDVLLEDDERERLLSWLAPRRAAETLAGEAWLFGPIGTAAVPDTTAMQRRIDDALKAADGSGRLTYNHLRHSFATYLLATLLLPQDVKSPAIPRELATVISPERFRRVTDRLLGSGRLGAGAVHAVSQLMGHTGPDMTLRWYCHLLDLSLGLYVGRASTLPPVSTQWADDLLGVGSCAARKVRQRHRDAASIPQPLIQHARPDRATIERHAPAFTANLVTASLFDAKADRLSRPVARALALDVERAANGIHPFEEARLRGKPQPEYPVIDRDAKPVRQRRPKRPPTMRVVPWRLIAAAALDELPAADMQGPHPEQMTRWSATATMLRRWRASPLRFAAVPDERDLRLMLDARLTLPRQLRRAEREALHAAVASLGRRGHVRVKRLSDARAIVTVLDLMGFRPTETDMAITNVGRWRFPSARVRRFLTGEERVDELAGRAGWRGSLLIRFRPADSKNPRLFARACHFALLMLFIDSQVGG